MNFAQFELNAMNFAVQKVFGEVELISNGNKTSHIVAMQRGQRKQLKH